MIVQRGDDGCGSENDSAMMKMVRGADGDGGCGFGGEVMMMYRRWIDGGVWQGWRGVAVAWAVGSSDFGR
ncbi:hypothetical protein Tco_1087442, partial [Tanacetum coccineum]